MNWIEQIKNITIPKEHFSQNGEEWYLDFIFGNIGTENKYLVDIGAGDGVDLSNSLHFRNNEWDGLLIDAKESSPLILQKKVTIENIVDILVSKKVPYIFDLLSIDTDGNDYWILRQVLKFYSPRVIVAEFNSSFDANASKAISYDANFEWAGNDYYGFTLAAAQKVAKEFGYKIIFQNNDMNCYFVKEGLIEGLEVPEVTYTKNDYFEKSNRTDWIEI
jgi:hypothetical protein